jgi:TRAP-type C4-dicarboxylate transport system substrate-binding protein
MAGEAPEFESLDLPGLTADIGQQREMANALRDDLTQIMATKFNVKLLTMSPIALQVLYCNKPVAGIDDLAGLKVRTFSRSMAELVEGLGAQSVNIPFAEVVPAMDRGVADCAITATSAGNTARWWEVTDHLVILPMGWSMIFFGANIDNWSRLPAATQDFLAEKFAEMEDRMWAQAASDVQDGIACNTAVGECVNGIKADRGMTLVELSEADRAKVAETLTQHVLKSWADRCGAGCVANWNAKAGTVIGVEIAGH